MKQANGAPWQGSDGRTRHGRERFDGGEHSSGSSAGSTGAGTRLSLTAFPSARTALPRKAETLATLPLIPATRGQVAMAHTDGLALAATAGATASYAPPSRQGQAQTGG